MQCWQAIEQAEEATHKLPLFIPNTLDKNFNVLKNIQ